MAGPTNACSADRAPGAAGRDFDRERRRLELDPSHPATHGSLKFTLELTGETIADLDVRIGYLHRGFEKECESRGWAQAIPYTDRLDYHSAILANLGFCLAVEKLMGLETSPRSRWLRVLGCEISRVGDHLLRCGSACHELGALPESLAAIEARERVADLQEALCGARVTANYVRIGGVRRDLPADFRAAGEVLLPKIRALLGDMDAAVHRNPVLLARLRDTGVLSRQDCLRYAVTGPILRAAGEPLDLRKQQPYLTYDEIDFDVPVGSVGDNYDRYLVCVAEARESLGIVEQCLARLERLGPQPIAGAVFDDPVRGPTVAAGEAYTAIESANGELGFYLVSDGSERPVKVRCRPPAFLHLAALPEMLREAKLADLVPTFELLNAVGGECDR
jgi:NADH-quinone oxidoreductase subunit D